MDGFSYHNIFDTKGIEYIAILFFFAILVPFWIVLNRKARIRKQAREAAGILTSSKLRIPQGLFFSRNHTWSHLMRSGIARVGLDDLLLTITGEVSVIPKAQPGDTIRKGDLLAVIDQNGKQLNILSPISGVIQSDNQAVLSQPEVLSEDPFRTGWLFEIKPSDWIAETSGFFLAGEATTWMSKELTRFKDFIVNAAGKDSANLPGIVLQDGGEIREHTLAEMPAGLWKDFEDSFLNSPG